MRTTKTVVVEKEVTTYKCDHCDYSTTKITGMCGLGNMNVCDFCKSDCCRDHHNVIYEDSSDYYTLGVCKRCWPLTEKIWDLLERSEWDVNDNEDLTIKEKTYELFKDFSKLTLKLEEIKYRQDNWDGVGSKAVKEISVTTAKNLIFEVAESIFFNNFEWIQPFISSDEDGFIIIDWYHNDLSLHFMIDGEKTEYIKVRGTNIQLEMDLGERPKENIDELWGWLIYDQLW